MTRGVSEPSDVDLERLEHAITAALDPFLEGWLDVPPSSRAETTEEGPTQDEGHRGALAGAALVALVTAAATTAGAAALADLGLKAASFKTEPIAAGVARLVGTSAAYEIAQARRALADFKAGRARQLARAERLSILKRWAAGIAVQAGTYTMNAGRDAALEAAAVAQSAVGDRFTITRTWTTKGDEKVRPAHAAVAGQTRPLGDPFDVAGTKMRYPGDTLAPPELTANCRCRLRYKITKG